MVFATRLGYSTTLTSKRHLPTRLVYRKSSLHQRFSFPPPLATLKDDQQQEAPSTTSTDPQTPDDLACYGTGAEVTCVLNDEDGEVVTVASTSGRTSSTSESLPITELLLLISPFFFWGTSMVAMKELAPHTTPLFIASWRLIPAGIALLAWAHASGRPQPKTSMAWFAVALFGLADGACFQGFLAEGLQRTSAGLGSVIIDSQPLTVALLASILFGERLGALGYAGLALGVGGLLLLEVPLSVLSSLPDMLLSSDPSATNIAAVDTLMTSSAAAAAPGVSSWSLWDSGEWWMLLAAQSMAIGTVMVRWVAKYCDPVVATGWHMILGGIPLLALAVAQEGDVMGANLALIDLTDVGLLLYVSLLGSAASYGVFFYEATVRGNLTALSSLTFLTPMFAAAGGYLVLGETLNPLQLFGAFVTLGAVALISNGSKAGEEEGMEKKEG